MAPQRAALGVVTHTPSSRTHGTTSATADRSGAVTGGTLKTTVRSTRVRRGVPAGATPFGSRTGGPGHTIASATPKRSFLSKGDMSKLDGLLAETYSTKAKRPAAFTPFGRPGGTGTGGGSGRAATEVTPAAARTSLFGGTRRVGSLFGGASTTRADTEAAGSKISTSEDVLGAPQQESIAVGDVVDVCTRKSHARRWDVAETERLVGKAALQCSQVYVE